MEIILITLLMMTICIYQYRIGILKRDYKELWEGYEECNEILRRFGVYTDFKGAKKRLFVAEEDGKSKLCVEVWNIKDRG